MTARGALDVATFDDRYTMRFVRELAAPVERVWEAVTGEELNIWLYPVTRVELALGGRATFTWGHPEDNPQLFKITQLDVPRLIRFSSVDKTGRVDHTGYMQFELAPIANGTRFTFIQKMGPVPEAQRVAHDSDLPKDARVPGGPDTPWLPGFVAGFHLNMDTLGYWLAMDWPREKIHEAVNHWIDATNGKIETDGKSYWADSIAYENKSPTWSALVDVYYDYIRRFLPGEDGVPPEPLDSYPGLAADLEARK